MFRIFVKTLFLTVLFYCVKSWSADLKACSSKEDCGLGHVCYEDLCRECLDCKLLYRKGVSCTLDFKDCGDCLEGYEAANEGKFTNFPPFTKFCKPVQVVLQSKKCSENTECPQDNYCLFNSCVQCFNCSIYNRLPSYKVCAKQFSECGPCFTGFHEVPVTTQSNSKPCVKNVPMISEKKTENFIFSGLDIFWIATMLLFTIFLLSYCTFKKKSESSLFNRYELRPWNSNQCNRIYEPSAPSLPQTPPPFYSDSFLDFSESKLRRRTEDEERQHLTFVNEEMQNAIVYQNPTVPYYTDPESWAERNNTPPLPNTGNSNSNINGNNEDEIINDNIVDVINRNNPGNIISGNGNEVNLNEHDGNEGPIESQIEENILPPPAPGSSVESNEENTNEISESNQRRN